MWRASAQDWTPCCSGNTPQTPVPRPSARKLHHHARNRAAGSPCSGRAERSDLRGRHKTGLTQPIRAYRRLLARTLPMVSDASSLLGLGHAACMMRADPGRESFVRASAWNELPAVLSSLRRAGGYRQARAHPVLVDLRVADATPGACPADAGRRRRSDDRRRTGARVRAAGGVGSGEVTTKAHSDHVRAQGSLPAPAALSMPQRTDSQRRVRLAIPGSAWMQGRPRPGRGAVQARAWSGPTGLPARNATKRCRFRSPIRGTAPRCGRDGYRAGSSRWITLLCYRQASAHRRRARDGEGQQVALGEFQQRPPIRTHRG